MATGPGRTASTRWSASGVPTVRGQRRAGPRRRPDGAAPRCRPASPCRPTSIWRRAGWTTCASCTPSCRDTVLMTGFGFTPPVVTPTWGVLERATAAGRRPDDRGAVLPRAAPGRQHRLHRGAVPRRSNEAGGRALPVYCASLRTAEPELLDTAWRRRRHGGHRAGRGRCEPGRRCRPAVTTTAGTSNTLPPWTSRSCKGLCLTSPRDHSGGQRRRAEPAGRRHPGRGAGVRRPHHHGSVLVQGDRRRRV